MSYDFTERIDRGVARLDETYPGWAAKINTRRLHLFSARSCVLGQLAAQFLPDMNVRTRFRALQMLLGIRRGYLSDFGFDIPFTVVTYEVLAPFQIPWAYHRLRKQWQARIKEITTAETITKVTQADLALAR